MSEGMPTPPGYSRSTGTVRALNLMVDFSDAPGQGSALDRLAEFFPQTQDWFRTSSYGRLDYRPEAPDHRLAADAEAVPAYGIERGAPFDPGYRQLVQDIVAAADPEVDFRAYDLLNVLVTPNAGPSALDTVLSVTFAGNARGAGRGRRAAWPTRPSSTAARTTAPAPTPRPGYRVLPHENGHVFGLPDLYTQRGRGRGRPLGHHERGLGGQQRPAGLAQVEAGLAGRLPGRLRGRRPARRSTR